MEASAPNSPRIRARRLFMVNCVVYLIFFKTAASHRITRPAAIRPLTASSPRAMSTLINDEVSIDPIRAELEALQRRSPLFSRPGFLIRRIHQIHGFLFAEETGEFNITPVQYSLLTALNTLGEIDQNTLAIEVGLERSSVAEVIPRLQSRGLVDRNRAAHDKRLKLVKLTRQGKRLVTKMAPAVQRAHERTLEHLPTEQRDFFMLQLIRLVEANNDNSLVPFRLPRE
jgi:DNA-binding MarR family transcriptional regulator